MNIAMLAEIAADAGGDRVSKTAVSGAARGEIGRRGW